MDFFQFASYAEMFVTMSMDENNNVPNRLWICLLVGGLCFLIVYVFQAFGLLTIAKREKIKNSWMAFVPFLNVYYIGVCAQKNKVYGMKTQHFAVIVAALEALLVAGYIIYYVSAFAVWDYIRWDPYYAGNDTGTILYYYPGAVEGLPAGMEWMGWSFMHLGTILSWVELVFIVVKLLLLTSFFRTYAARQYIWFSIAGALLPLTGILIYVVRNNKGMNYMDYIRKVRERNYRMYQQQYGNPYNQNPYSGGYGGGYNGQNGTQGGSGGSAPDPFDGEYGASGGSNSGSGANSGGPKDDGGSPFDEFN